MNSYSYASQNEPRCDKCGAEITTGLMAVFCPQRRQCEFYVPEVEDFRPSQPTATNGQSVQEAK